MLDIATTTVKFGPHPLIVRKDMPGIALIRWFDNGFGASVIRFPGSREAEAGLWEVAVVSPATPSGGVKLRWDTPVGDDVFGMLTEAEVVEVLDRIAALPAEQQRDRRVLR